MLFHFSTLLCRLSGDENLIDIVRNLCLFAAELHCLSAKEKLRRLMKSR
jgi:hypothetical protein